MRVRRFCLFAFAALAGCTEERVLLTEAVDDGLIGGPAFTSGTRGQFVEREAVESQVTETPQPLPGAEEAVQSPPAGTGATATDETPPAPTEPATKTTVIVVPAPYPFGPAASAAAPAASAATQAAYGTPPAEEAPREIDPSPEEPDEPAETTATDEMPPEQTGAPRSP
jgi:hypothetical protein